MPPFLLNFIGGFLKPALEVAKSVLSRKVRISTVLLVLGVVALGYYLYMRRQANHGEVPQGWTKPINDSTKATTVKPSLGKNELPALTDAAKSVKGTLVAGVKIVTKPDTVWVPVKEVIQSTVLPDSTRKAVLEDSVQGYKIRIDAEAPPFPANLKIGYSFIVPSFQPEVGFVKIGNSYAATVSWGGNTFELKDAFLLPTEPTWRLYGSASEYLNRLPKTVPSPMLSLNLDRKVGASSTVTLTGYAIPGSDRGIAVGVSRTLWSK